tara:strand:- start:476 stop:1021 length:546 start_codon:yes stop_codon:yes gene_type:complete
MSGTKESEGKEKGKSVGKVVEKKVKLEEEATEQNKNDTQEKSKLPVGENVEKETSKSHHHGHHPHKGAHHDGRDKDHRGSREFYNPRHHHAAGRKGEYHPHGNRGQKSARDAGEGGKGKGQHHPHEPRHYNRQIPQREDQPGEVVPLRLSGTVYNPFPIFSGPKKGQVAHPPVPHTDRTRY